jgi:hypothetical protein
VTAILSIASPSVAPLPVTCSPVGGSFTPLSSWLPIVFSDLQAADFHYNLSSVHITGSYTVTWNKPVFARDFFFQNCSSSDDGLDGYPPPDYPDVYDTYGAGDSSTAFALSDGSYAFYITPAYAALDLGLIYSKFSALGPAYTHYRPLTRDITRTETFQIADDDMAYYQKGILVDVPERGPRRITGFPWGAPGASSTYLSQFYGWYVSTDDSSVYIAHNGLQRTLLHIRDMYVWGQNADGSLVPPLRFYAAFGNSFISEPTYAEQDLYFKIVGWRRVSRSSDIYASNSYGWAPIYAFSHYGPIVDKGTALFAFGIRPDDGNDPAGSASFRFSSQITWSGLWADPYSVTAPFLIGYDYVRLGDNLWGVNWATVEITSVSIALHFSAE